MSPTAPISTESQIVAKSSWRDYEVLAQTILREAHQVQGVSNLTVEHDVQLQGKILSHQIDVLIRFERSGVQHTVIVQCKDWDSTVKQEHLLAFAGVLDDLPDHPTGIFVTRKGYQKGARQLAKAKNIILYTLRARTEKDLIIERIEINTTGYYPWSSQPDIKLDQAWINQQATAQKLPHGKEIQLRTASDEKSLLLYNEDGTLQQSLYELKTGLFPAPLHEIPGQMVTHRFAVPTFIHNSGDPHFPIVRLESVTYEIAVIAMHNHIVVESENIVAYILADILDGDTATFDRELHFVAHFYKM